MPEEPTQENSEQAGEPADNSEASREDFYELERSNDPAQPAERAVEGEQLLDRCARFG